MKFKAIELTYHLENRINLAKPDLEVIFCPYLLILDYVHKSLSIPVELF